MHRSAHRITVISRVLLERAKRFGKDAVLIPNGILLQDLKAASASHPKIDGRILFAGRLEQMKGVETLLDAFASLAEKHPAAHLVIVGDGSLRPTLEARQPALMTQGRIAFRGYLPPQRIAAEFAQAAIFCGLSRSEALGNVFLEAQAAGCAVVATTVGGIPDIVTDGHTGLLVPPDDVSAAAAAVDRLLSDDDLRMQLGGEGRKNAEAYDWESIAKRYGEVYGEELKIENGE
jgi:glycosyltransferase involved in cell wall biosynthesis